MSEQRTVGRTLYQVAELIPNRKGTGHIHPQTLIRRVARGEFPAPDFTFTDGTRVWHDATLRRAKILPQHDAA